MAYAILRIQKLKQSNLGGSGSHVSRSRHTPNADLSKRDENQTLIHNGDVDLPLSKIVQERIDATPQLRKIRTDAVYAIEILLTASPDFYRPGAPTDYGVYDPVILKSWVAANIDWLKSEYKDKVVRAELHLDEATPHIHAYVVPTDDRGQLNCKKMLGKKHQLVDLQDNYARAMQPLGLERGNKGSLAIHTDVKRYYSDVNDYCGAGGAQAIVTSLQEDNARLKLQLIAMTTERDKLAEKFASLVSSPQIEKVELVSVTQTAPSAINPASPPERQLSAQELIERQRLKEQSIQSDRHNSTHRREGR
jgi:Plasmid recombination enzyme